MELQNLTKCLRSVISGLNSFLEAIERLTLQEALLWHVIYKPNTTIEQSGNSKNLRSKHALFESHLFTLPVSLPIAG